jgi:hypothetical protein
MAPTLCLLHVVRLHVLWSSLELAGANTRIATAPAHPQLLASYYVIDSTMVSKLATRNGQLPALLWASLPSPPVPLLPPRSCRCLNSCLFAQEGARCYSGRHTTWPQAPPPPRQATTTTTALCIRLSGSLLTEYLTLLKLRLLKPRLLKHRLCKLKVSLSLSLSRRSTGGQPSSSCAPG